MLYIEDGSRLHIRYADRIYQTTYLVLYSIAIRSKMDAERFRQKAQ